LDPFAPAAGLLADRIPEAGDLPGLGQLLFWEDPDGFADAVASFLLDGTDGQESRDLGP
jgi:hypothetical protein